ncbi:MAG: 3-isopropylmalate dehydrogenase [Firmicutes bacterium]|nr:3-isopropylmalate dehydrogenase [Bacillota bacterium]
MKINFAIIRGDGVGNELTAAAVSVLDAVSQQFSHEFNYETALLGGEAFDIEGTPIPGETLEICKKSDAVLVGAVGGVKWEGEKQHLRPEKGLSTLKKELGLFTGVQPIFLHQPLHEFSPLKKEVFSRGCDFVIVRELSGGMYFGESGHRKTQFGQEAFDTEVYNVKEIERIARAAFEMALKRRKRLVSVDKANIMATGKLWRATVEHISKDYPEVLFTSLLFEECVQRVMVNPFEFDVILAPNMLGDLLSNVAVSLTGIPQTLPCSAMGEKGVRRGLYRSLHPSKNEKEGQDKANPVGTILASAMMLANSFDMFAECMAIQMAVHNVLSAGFRTPDIASKRTRTVSCTEFGVQVAMNILSGRKRK